MAKRGYSAEEKLEILMAHENGEYSISEICSIYSINPSTLSRWKHKYEESGADGLKVSTTNKKYPEQLKLAAIKDYQSGMFSLREVTRKYELSNDGVLSKWIKKYNSHREIKAIPGGTDVSMTKRTTTWEERINIALHCIENNKNYQRTSEIFKVSYQQVYQWVKKYEKGGDEALKDKRGQNKPEEELTPEEKVKLQMKRLERENERLRAENEFLKS